MANSRGSSALLVVCVVLAALTNPTSGHILGGEAQTDDQADFLRGLLSTFKSSFRHLGSRSAPGTHHSSDLARFIFRFADLTGTTSSHLLEDDVRPVLTLQQISQKLSAERVTEALQRLAEEEQLNPRAGHPQAGTEAWDDDCYRDLATFIEPITDVVLTAALSLLPDDSVGNGIRQILSDLYIRGLQNKTIPDWGLTMLDAFGKVPAGLEYGALHWVGGYELCKSQEVQYIYNISAPSEERSFKGQYCRVDVEPKRMENESASIAALTFGMCVPSSCSPENVTSFLSSSEIGRGSTRLLGILQELLELDVEGVFCGHDGLTLDTDPPARAAIAVLLVVIILLVAGTLWDGVFRSFWLLKCIEKHDSTEESKMAPPQYDEVTQSSENHVPSLQRPLSTTSTSRLVVNDLHVGVMKEISYWNQSPGWFGRVDLFFVAFSVKNNLRKLLHVDRSRDHLRVVDAVKFLAVCYLILGQTYLLGPVVSFVLVTPNIINVLRTLPKQWNFMPILGFHHTTDTFFVCSGLLMTLYWFRRIERNSGRLTPWLIVRNILHWYWRLMPSMMMVMMIFVVFYKYLANGPLSPRSIPFADNCKPNWWTNLLMLQNLVNLDKQCMAWTWYFSAIFQLHLVATAVLIIYHFSPIASYVTISALVAAHYGATAGQSNDILKGGLLGSFRTWNTYLYITPWCHAGAYFMGVTLAFILRGINFKMNLNIVFKTLGWLVALGLIVLVTYIPYDMYRDLDISRWSRGAQVTYDTLSRTGWSLGVSWIIFACVTGNGGFIGELLSWRAFQPLGRLTYSVYIMHAIAVLRFISSRMSLLYVAENEMVYLFFGNLVMSHVYGLLCAMLFEYPFRGLEKMISCRTRLDAMLSGTHPKVKKEDEKKSTVERRLTYRIPGPQTDTADTKF